jgi:hypothetical protein
MKKFFALVLMLLASSLMGQSKPVSVVGKWTMTLDMSMGVANPALEFTRQDGEKIMGSYTGRYGTSPLQGTVKDRIIDFTVSMSAEGDTVTMDFTGEVSEDGQSITKGKAVLGGLGDATWSAKKDKN